MVNRALTAKQTGQLYVPALNSDPGIPPVTDQLRVAREAATALVGADGDTTARSDVAANGAESPGFPDSTARAVADPAINLPVPGAAPRHPDQTRPRGEEPDR